MRFQPQVNAFILALQFVWNGNYHCSRSRYHTQTDDISLSTLFDLCGA